NRPDEFSAWLGAVILPSRRVQLISIRQLGSIEFQNGILREVVYGPKPIFGPEQVERVEKEESTIFIQRGQRRPIASLAVCMDARLIFGKQVGDVCRNTYSIVRQYVIDQDEIQVVLGTWLEYADSYFSSFDSSSPLTSFYFGGSLTGVARRGLGRIPNPAP